MKESFELNKSSTKEDSSERNPTVEELRKMKPDGRIEFFRGAIPDFGERVENALTSAFKNQDVDVENISEEDFSRIKRCFRDRIESHLCQTGTGGDPLAHLTQTGVKLISEEIYIELSTAAAVVAGKIIADVGGRDGDRWQYAVLSQQAYAVAGKLLIDKYTQ